ncbi:hypothetical protein D5F11_010875 [Siminovitchia terrae]|uniref:Uncharacterized protein n=1 Tax=Siminovitchia terrae TaxID=1914933 RepID=A0A429X8S0_SIMTE|nr:hypothetical protein [Siminovitchia terrae]RST59603.1 hypothetical protein D5F11_010875 [Siminovitchia terrae]
MNAYWYSIQWGFKPRLNKVKASGGCLRFSEEIYRGSIKSGRKYAKAHVMVKGKKITCFLLIIKVLRIRESIWLLRNLPLKTLK